MHYLRLNLADITYNILNLLHSIQMVENHFVCSLKLASNSQCSILDFQSPYQTGRKRIVLFVEVSCLWEMTPLSNQIQFCSTLCWTKNFTGVFCLLQASSPSLRCFTFAINALCLLNLKEKQGQFRLWTFYNINILFW